MRSTGVARAALILAIVVLVGGVAALILLQPEGSVNAQPNPEEKGWYSLVSDAELLSGQGSGTSVLSMKAFESVLVLDVKDDWAEVRCRGKVGWVPVALLSKAQNVNPQETVLPTPTPLVVPPEQPPFTVTEREPPAIHILHRVLANPATMYETPSLKSAVIASIPKDEIVEVDKIEGNFGELSYNGETGWVPLSELTWAKKEDPATPTPQPQKTPSAVNYYVAADQANIYRSASTSSLLLGELSWGERISVSETSSGYAKLANRDGWVSLDDLSTSKPERESTTRYYATGDPSYVYRSADTGSGVLKTIAYGDTVDIGRIIGGYGHASTSAGWGWIPMKSISATKPEEQPTLYYVNTGATDVFREASASAVILDTLYRGDTVYVHSVSKSFGEIKRSSGSGTGWVRMKDLSKEKPSEPTKSDMYYAVGAQVNVYRYPSASSSTVDTLSHGSTVYVYSKYDTFGELRRNGAIAGWVSLSDLSSARPNDPVRYYTTADSTPVYVEASASASTQRTLEKGAEVWVYRTASGFSEIRHAYGYGWVQSGGLSATQPTPTPTPSPSPSPGQETEENGDG